MRREDRFVMSHRPYAVDVSSLRLRNEGLGDGFFDMDAVWFRRKNGITGACIGVLWDLQRPDPADAAEYLVRHDDGRYGGDCLGRWDGENYWGAGQNPDVNAAYLALLRTLLDAYEADPKAPALSAPWTGWWVF